MGNLKSWKKGESGNPKGRPKGSKNRSTVIRELLEITQNSQNTITGNPEKLSVEQQITLAIIGKALKGDVNAYEKLMNSAYGMAKQETENKHIIQDKFEEMTDEELEKYLKDGKE